MVTQRIRAGFTLVELLVVIAIIGILVALLLPAVQAAREAARRMSCSNNVKQIVLALHNYHDVNKKFPFAQLYRGIHDGDPTSSEGGTGFGWSFSILPFIEQNQLHDQFDQRFVISDTTNSRNGILAQTFLPGFSCPSDKKPTNWDRNAIPKQATTSYNVASGSYNGYASAVVGGNPNLLRYNGLFGRNNRGGPFAIRDVQDGTTNTIAVAEVRWDMNINHRNVARLYGRSRNAGDAGGTNSLCVQGEWPMNWSEIEGNPQPERTASSAHSGGAQFGLADGSVRFIAETIQHTATSWIDNANAFDEPNGGANYGLYQRLYSISDSLAVSPF